MTRASSRGGDAEASRHGHPRISRRLVRGSVFIVSASLEDVMRKPRKRNVETAQEIEDQALDMLVRGMSVDAVSRVLKAESGRSMDYIKGVVENALDDDDGVNDMHKRFLE